METDLLESCRNEVAEPSVVTDAGLGDAMRSHPSTGPERF